MMFAVLNENGVATAFYDDEVHLSIPEDAVEISREQWAEYIENNGRLRFVDGELVEYVHVPTAEEVQAQSNAEALRYLNSTDWYVTRFTETGIAIPDEVSEKRAEARASIKEVIA